MTVMAPSSLATLRKLALEARSLAYAPYSGYHVGAAIMATDGSFYGGCGNSENANYSSTVHGEVSAVLQGQRAGCIERLGPKFVQAVYLAPALSTSNAHSEGLEVVCFPCGSCRQMVAELGAHDGEWVIEAPDGKVTTYSFKELLPFPEGFRA